MRRGGKRWKRKKKKIGEKKMIPLKIYFNNIRGFPSKSESLKNILENKVKADIVLLNETGLRGNSKINIKNYVSFTKNNPKKQLVLSQHNS